MTIKTPFIKKIILPLILILILLILFVFNPKPQKTTTSSSLPKPSITPTPTEVPNNWKTYTDPKLNISFKYPENLTTTYINAVDWPPKINLDTNYYCTEGGSEDASAGKTERKTINGHIYCLTKETEGAAGSIYTQYAYAGDFDGKTAILTFSLRFPQCANYEDAEKTACENERKTFDIDQLMDKIFQTIH